MYEGGTTIVADFFDSERGLNSWSKDRDRALEAITNYFLAINYFLCNNFLAIPLANERRGKGGKEERRIGKCAISKKSRFPPAYMTEGRQPIGIYCK